MRSISARLAELRLWARPGGWCTGLGLLPSMTFILGFLLALVICYFVDRMVLRCVVLAVVLCVLARSRVSALSVTGQWTTPAQQSWAAGIGYGVATGTFSIHADDSQGAWVGGVTGATVSGTCIQGGADQGGVLGAQMESMRMATVASGRRARGAPVGKGRGGRAAPTPAGYRPWWGVTS